MARDTAAFAPSPEVTNSGTCVGTGDGSINVNDIPIQFDGTVSAVRRTSPGGPASGLSAARPGWSGAACSNSDEPRSAAAMPSRAVDRWPSAGSPRPVPTGALTRVIPMIAAGTTQPPIPRGRCRRSTARVGTSAMRASIARQRPGEGGRAGTAAERRAVTCRASATARLTTTVRPALRQVARARGPLCLVEDRQRVSRSHLGELFTCHLV